MKYRKEEDKPKEKRLKDGIAEAQQQAMVRRETLDNMKVR